MGKPFLRVPPRNYPWIKVSFGRPRDYEKIWGSMLYGGPRSDSLDTVMDRFSGVRPYIHSRRFSSSVTSRPLYDDHHYHSTAELAFPLNLGLCGAP